MSANARAVLKVKSGPKAFEGLIKEIKAGNEYCRGVVAEAKEATAEFNALDVWLKKQSATLDG